MPIGFRTWSVGTPPGNTITPVWLPLVWPSECQQCLLLCHYRTAYGYRWLPDVSRWCCLKPSIRLIRQAGYSGIFSAVAMPSMSANFRPGWSTWASPTNHVQSIDVHEVVQVRENTCVCWEWLHDCFCEGWSRTPLASFWSPINCPISFNLYNMCSNS